MAYNPLPLLFARLEDAETSAEVLELINAYLEN